MINLIVDNLTGTLQQVSMGGATLVGETEDLEYGRSGCFMETEGNKIKLWQPK